MFVHFCARQIHLHAQALCVTTRSEYDPVETGQFNFDPDELAFINSHWVHLDHEQRLSGSAGISYRWQQTTFSGDLLYGSGLRDGFANTEHLPGYTQVNAAVAQNFALGSFGKLDARLSVINLFDRSYELRDGTGIGVGAPWLLHQLEQTVLES
jgi:hypothetical protein